MANDKAFRRVVRCPYCGFQTTTGCIGAVHCGPHRHSYGYTPAVRMIEVDGHTDQERSDDVETDG